MTNFSTTGFPTIFFVTALRRASLRGRVPELRIDDSGVKRSATFDTDRDARDFKAKLRMLKRSGELAMLGAGRETLAQFAARWWEVEAVPNLELATLKSYASHWNRHVLPALGQVELRRITPERIAEFRADLQHDGVENETVRRTLAMLQGIFARAVEWQRVAFNPVKVVRKPRAKDVHRCHGSEI